MKQQRDERERIQLQKIMDNTVAIRSNLGSAGGHSGPSSAPAAAPLSPGENQEVLKQITRTRKKVESLEEMLQNRLSVMANEVQKSNSPTAIGT